MKDLPGSVDGFAISVKMVLHTYELQRLRMFVPQWDLEFGCNLQEDSDSVRLIIGRIDRTQFILLGRKTQTHAFFEQGRIEGSLREDALLDILNWIASVQTSSGDTLGLVISKNGKAVWPLVIRNGEIYDETKMMEFLWNHYSVTRVKEARRLEDVYHFLRDVPKQLWTWIPGTIGNLLFLQPLL